MMSNPELLELMATDAGKEMREQFAAGVSVQKAEFHRRASSSDTSTRVTRSLRTERLRRSRISLTTTRRRLPGAPSPRPLG
jgi:hypothetical protein